MRSAMRTDSDKRQWVYESLCDDISKAIFENRRKYAESGEWRYIENIVAAIPEYASNVYYGGKEKVLYEKLREYRKKIVLFGYGYRARKILCGLHTEAVEVAYVVDSDVRKQGALAGKIPIVSLSEIMAREHVDDLVFLITSAWHVEEIRSQLQRAGCKYIENANEYTKCFRQDQYFDRGGFLEFAEQEIFVDGGCFDLETTRIFRKLLEEEGKTCSKVYAFEPDRNNYLTCREKIDHCGWQNISLVNAGLWREDTWVKLENAGTAGAHLVEAGEDEKHCVRAVSLDTVVDGKDKISLIKLDIEGAELEALQGAERIIRRDRPKLAVCIYHKKEDYWQIPYYLKSLAPEYRFYIRHYSNYSAETVLYAVVNERERNQE